MNLEESRDAMEAGRYHDGEIVYVVMERIDRCSVDCIDVTEAAEYQTRKIKEKSKKRKNRIYL